MLRKMEPLGEVCSVTRRLLRRGWGLQTSRRVNVFSPAKGRMLFEQATAFEVVNLDTFVIRRGWGGSPVLLHIYTPWATQIRIPKT
jgi:hypothetical protein